MKAINWLIIIGISIAVTVIIGMAVFGFGINASKTAPVSLTTATIQTTQLDKTGQTATLNLTVALRNLGTRNITIFHAVVTINHTTFTLHPVAYIDATGNHTVKGHVHVNVKSGEAVTIIFSINGTNGYKLYKAIINTGSARIPFMIYTDSKPIYGNAIYVTQPS
ncbi:MAG: hypothetical protein GXO26_03695 [Crenarchaeota archaeon]|nr:hypothetical protein [Thermoproteota archaeon]